MGITHKDLKRIIKRHYETKESLLIFGGTGIGKSQIVRQAAIELAESLDLKYSEGWRDVNNSGCFCLSDIRASDLDRTDIAGYPVPDHETKSMKFYGFEGFPRSGKGIIFFDEINLAPASVQKALYAIVHDRHLHGYEVPEGYLVIGAGNTFDDRADITAMPAPLEQRFSIFTLDPPGIDDWIDWASAHRIDSRIIIFLKRFPQYLFKFNPDVQMSGQPVPRQWEHLSRLIAGEGDLEFIRKLSAGRVGEAAATQFTSFVKLAHDVDIEGIFAGTKPFPETVDLAYAIMPGMANIWNSAPEKNFNHALDILESYEKSRTLGPEFAVLWIRVLKTTNTAASYDCFKKSKRAGDALLRYSKYLLEV